MDFKKISELEYTAPEGGWDCTANVSWIISEILVRYPNVNFELSKREFIGLMSVFGYEVMVSALLDDRKLPLNEILRTGFDFRGIQMKILA